VKNANAISAVSRQMTKIFSRIDTITMDIESLEQTNPGLAETYEELRFGELEQAQVLILELTKLVTEASGSSESTHGDDGGSVFAAGDLTAVKVGEVDGVVVPDADDE